MDEAERQSQSQNYGRKKEQLAQSGFPVAPAQMKVESGAAQLPDRQKTIQTDVHEEQLIQSLQSAGPCSVEPAQVHGQPERQQNDGIAPVTALLRIGRRPLL